MFYLFFESRNSEKDPVVIWLTGGPGCSSELAVFYENGPFQIANDLSLVWNDYGWDKVSWLLFVVLFSKLQLICLLFCFSKAIPCTLQLLIKSCTPRSWKLKILVDYAIRNWHLQILWDLFKKFADLRYCSEIWLKVGTKSKIICTKHSTSNHLLIPNFFFVYDFFCIILQASNLLFVDQPIGTGFSYSSDQSDIRHDEEGVSNDLFDFLQVWVLPEY